MKRVGTDRQAEGGKAFFFFFSSLCYQKAVNQRAGVLSEHSICYVSCTVLFSCFYSYCLDSDSRSLFLAAQTDKNKLFTSGRLLFLIHIPLNDKWIFLPFGNKNDYRPTALQGNSELVLGGHINYLQTHLPSAGIVAKINRLNTKCRLLYLKTQFVPRSKHFSSRL